MAVDSDTAPATGRDYEIEPEESKPFTPQSFTPDKAWLDEFQKQTTVKMLERVRKYARTRAGLVAVCGDARELVFDALGDTRLGVLRWDPTRCSLEQHLVRVIQSRTFKEASRAKRIHHIAMGDDTEASRHAEQDASSAVVDPEYPIVRIHAREALAQLRRLAEGDKDILRILDAFAAGAQTREDVLALAKMKAHTYHKAHIRLMRIIRNLNHSTLTPKARA